MSEQAKNTWGELLENAVKQVADVETLKNVEIKSTVSRIALMVPWLLKNEDFWNLVYELDAIRHPKVEEKPLLKAVEEETPQQAQKTIIPANNSYSPSMTKQAA